MKAIKFTECNTIFAKEQQEYKQLPALYDEETSIVLTCYRLSFSEIIKILFTHKLWLGIMTFGESLQPQLPTVNKKDFLGWDYEKEETKTIIARV